MASKAVLGVCAAIALTAVQLPAAQAGDRYLSFDFVGATTNDDFGGANTVFIEFLNSDEDDNTKLGLSLSYGVRDAYKVGGISLTPELEVAWFDDYSASSASFPGLPAPIAFYDSSIQTARLGANIWWPIYETGLWRTEAGFGGGLLYRDFSTSDGVVSGSTDDVTGYGQIGVRALRSIGDRSNIKLGVNYVLTGQTDLDLNQDSDGAPAGVLSLDTRSLELRLGYELKLN